MRIALFIPCYVDRCYPAVGRATLRLLQALCPDSEIVFPTKQTCCGQPMLNAGCADASRDTANHFVTTFSGFDAVVAPSASCVAMVRHHYADLVSDQSAYAALAPRVFELCQFLVEQRGIRSIGGRFAHRVGLHRGCHGLRDLGQGASSESRKQCAVPAEILLR
ncbi:MAG: (Fe-S)-binding protein, partial [Planctomycetota bacterium]|nr:(Fe-S)-binding protein [Planctomycetota bacterium]